MYIRYNQVAYYFVGEQAPMWLSRLTLLFDLVCARRPSKDLTTIPDLGKDYPFPEALLFYSLGDK